MTIQIKPSGSALGAEIVGADLTKALDDATFAQIRAAFYQHEVVYSTVKADAEVTHPLVRVHPVNGRKCLYVTEGYTARIVGMPEDDSRELIAELAKHCVKPEFTYLHNWHQHDLVMWDDCSTQHKATFDYPASLPRLMHRTRVIGGVALH